MKAFKFFAIVSMAALPFAMEACSKKSSGAGGATVVSTGGDTLDAPPYNWQEHWGEHNQLLTRQFYDSNLAVYFDDDVNRSVKWPFTYLDSAWKYTKKIYGKFGTDERMFAIFHAGRYSGGHPSTFFDDSHDYRNVIDCGSDDLNAWVTGVGNDIDLTTHEIGHIVEGASKGTHNSPAFGLWGDSKWMEIFQYDVYLGVGRTDDATRWFNMMVAADHYDSYPSANSHWFRDFWYPMYTTYGGAKVLNGYFTLLAKYFPTSVLDGGYHEYTRDLNWGEFIHFWSGAAGTNLKALSTKAFGWNATWESEFVQAQTDFPDITYTGK